ncbi:MAG TPA: hypothetical protein VGH09_08805 [Solirubrobacteraceae bacterium]
MASRMVQTTGLARAARLRHLPARGDAAKAVADPRGPRLRLLSSARRAIKPVLLAGGGSAARDSIRRDLAQTMPTATEFEQVGALWEVLARAPESSMVILGGELDDVPAESVMQMLAHRHPALPVVRFDETAAPAAVAARA